MNLSVAVPEEFDLWRTIYSHGWSSLPPFFIDKSSPSLLRVFELTPGKFVTARISRASDTRLRVSILARRSLSSPQRTQLVHQVKACLRLDESYTEFYRVAQSMKEYRWIPKSGAGRMLRAPTVFEDAVKMMCTTNCSWALTELIVRNLCAKLGKQIDENQFSFPQSGDLAECSERFLRKEIRSGYRSPYLLEFARRTSSGDLKIEEWRTSDAPTPELFDEVRSVKGIGPYAAGNILKLLGRYDYLGIDSWCRKKFFEIHKNGRTSSDRVIERHYEPFGKWRGLFFWLDVTKHWYDTKFPF